MQYPLNSRVNRSGLRTAAFLFATFGFQDGNLSRCNAQEGSLPAIISSNKVELELDKQHLPALPNESNPEKTDEFSSVTEVSTDPILRWGVWAVAFIAAIRGVGKLALGAYKRSKERADFATGRTLATPATNMHSISFSSNGKPELHINTVHNPDLMEIFRTAYSCELFKRICDKCDEARPFPSLHYSKNVEANFLWAILNTRVTSWLLHKRPAGEVLKREFDQLFQGYWSEQRKQGVFYLEAGEQVKTKFFYFIPVIEIKPNKRRELIFRVISTENFERFNNFEFTNGLKYNNPHHSSSIEQLVLAYKYHSQYLVENKDKQDSENRLPDGHSALTEPGDTFFPWVRIYLPNGRKG